MWKAEEFFLVCRSGKYHTDLEMASGFKGKSLFLEWRWFQSDEIDGKNFWGGQSKLFNCPKWWDSKWSCTAPWLGALVSLSNDTAYDMLQLAVSKFTKIEKYGLKVTSTQKIFVSSSLERTISWGVRELKCCVLLWRERWWHLLKIIVVLILTRLGKDFLGKKLPIFATEVTEQIPSVSLIKWRCPTLLRRWVS